MKANEASTTALKVAMHRAAHQLFDVPHVFEDPLALRLVGPDAEASIRAAPEFYESPDEKQLRALVVARSRYSEDAVKAAFARGVRQYVVLGAGFDTFACRNGESALRVFEVDHPSTQRQKREMLASAGLTMPSSAAFAAVDFEGTTLGDGLAAAGFDPKAPVIFSWLGVTPYLTTAAIIKTAWFVAERPVSELVLDFLLPSESMSPRERRAFDTFASDVASLGEPWLSFFEPDALVRELVNVGFDSADVIGPRQLSHRYFRDRTDGLDVDEFAHLAHARKGVR